MVLSRLAAWWGWLEVWPQQDWEAGSSVSFQGISEPPHLPKAFPSHSPSGTREPDFLYSSSGLLKLQKLKLPGPLNSWVPSWHCITLLPLLVK